MHHSIIHKESPTRCNSVSTFYFIFIWSSTCFGRHTAHRQEPENALAASGFGYVESCWICNCWTFSGRDFTWQHPATTRPTTLYVCKTRGCYCSFRLLVMDGVLPETCWASYEYEIIKILIHCCIQPPVTATTLHSPPSPLAMPLHLGQSEANNA